VLSNPFQKRAAVQEGLAGDASKKGRILAALRRSPLVGQDLDLTRLVAEERKVDRAIPST